jgi:hypothetical protein
MSGVVSNQTEAHAAETPTVLTGREGVNVPGIYDF